MKQFEGQIDCHRMEINSDALPITLMHPVFAEFVQSYKNAKVTFKSCAFAQELRQVALGEYMDES